MLLTNKSLVIIGGTTGMGLSAAKAFIENGAHVVVVGRNEEKATNAKAILGDRAESMCGDAIMPSTAVDAIEMCLSRFGSFDGLYHVAGGSGRKIGDGPLHELTLEGWSKTMEMNLTSLMLSNQAAVKQFLARGRGGTILNIASILAYSPSPNYFATHAYAAAKSGVIGFSKSIASYYAKNNIRVNVIVPSLVETPMSTRAINDQGIQSFIKTKQPLDGGRMGQPSDLDGLAVYFMSDQSRFTTGQVIAVDGGWSISDGQV
ncbi:MAG: SDR family NAD(P)-dependent oxidoreductase [Candidatus Saccharibacteria bacterium]